MKLDSAAVVAGNVGKRTETSRPVFKISLSNWEDYRYRY